jgi:aromatic ring hydroxylase
VVLDDVLVPWEDVFFYRHTRVANYIRGTLHRYSAFTYVLCILYVARSDDRGGAVEREVDRSRQAADGA